jgi:hypothetical protein
VKDDTRNVCDLGGGPMVDPGLADVEPGGLACASSSFCEGVVAAGWGLLGFDFLSSPTAVAEVARAMEARDAANAAEWKRRGSLGMGQPHPCQMCGRNAQNAETANSLRLPAARSLVMDASAGRRPGTHSAGSRARSALGCWR